MDVNNCSKSSNIGAVTTEVKFCDSILTRTLKTNSNEKFILNLIKFGCNINKPCEENLQPLHLAMRLPSLLIIHELIKHGANINAQDDWKWTPLQYAVRRGNLEATCMLLYYGADVSIEDSGKRTPLMNALDMGQEDVAEVLIDYYDNFSCTGISNARALDYALWNRSPLAIKLVKAGADVDRCRNERSSPIVRSFKHYSNNELFKAIWPRLDHRLIVNKRPSFLLSYLIECIFPPEEWLESLILILSSPVAPQLIEECENSMTLRTPFMSFLLHSLHRNKVAPSDRLAIIYLCLSLGATVRLLDIHFIICFSKHKFNDEIQSFIYGGSFNMNGYLPKSVRPQSVFMLGMDEEEDARSVFDFCKILIKVAPNLNVLKCVVQTVKYFSIPSKIRTELVDLFNQRFNGEGKLSEKLEGIPRVPSLLELSRDSARKFLKNTYPIERPYQFHDVVKNLIVPSRLKDVLLFKTPPY